MHKKTIQNHLQKQSIDLHEIIVRQKQILKLKQDSYDTLQPNSLIALAKTVTPKKMLLNKFQYDQSQKMKVKLYQSLEAFEQREKERNDSRAAIDLQKKAY